MGTMTPTARVRRQRTAAAPLSVEVRVEAFVQDGNVDREALAHWITCAIEHYHVFRGGHVGSGVIVGGIRQPHVSLID